MTRSVDKTDIILPAINAALQAADRPLAHVTEEGVGLNLCFGEGLVYKIRQLGTLTAAMLPKILDDFNPAESILWVQYLTEGIAVELIRRKVCYADTAGNMNLRLRGSILQVRNCPKPAAVKEALAVGRCFTATGLKVLFLLLTEPEALQWSYRKMAGHSGVCLGAVSYTMVDLQAKRYVMEDKGQRRWADVQHLRRLWVENYHLRLLPTLRVTRYAGEVTALPEGDAVIYGGESVAVAENLLTTGNTLLWKQNASIARTILANRWHQDAHGNIEVRDAFWPTAIRRFAKNAPWLLVYADLLATGDGRCMETAEEIRKRHLKGVL